MRPQQQNRRMRGRNNGGGNNNNNNNNNNRRGPNPLNRNYESNGPDVKIRGSAQQIAEKYATLARDAQSSGDRVMAENYLQHAEHYNRIIAAAQAQMPIQQAQQNRDDFDDDMDEERDDFDSGNGDAQPAAAGNGSGPQPVIEGMPAEVALNGEGNREGNGGNRHQQRDRRNGNYNHQNGQRPERGNEQRGNEARRSEAPVDNTVVEVAPAGDVAAPAQPQFEGFNPAAIAAQAEAAETQNEAPRKARRPRRSARDTAGAEGDAAVQAEGGDTPVVPAEG